MSGPGSLVTVTPGSILGSARRLVEEAVAQIPPDKHIAAVAVFTATPGQAPTVTLGIAVKAGNHLQVSASLMQEFTKVGPTATVAVHATW